MKHAASGRILLWSGGSLWIGHSGAATDFHSHHAVQISLSSAPSGLRLCGPDGRWVLHFWNQTPGEWFSKKQATVETATYGSEFVAARTAVDQIEDTRQTLRYLGIPINEKSYLFGDNASVVISGTTPQSALRKRHSLLCYHRVREAVASEMMVFSHMPGDSNPADIVSKHWGYQQVWPMLRSILFWNGRQKVTKEDPVQEEAVL